MTLITHSTVSAASAGTKPKAFSNGATTSLPHRPLRTHPSSTSTTSPTTSLAPTAPSRPALQSPAALSTPLSLPTSSLSHSLPHYILTRRRRYLETHPSYFASASGDAELSNPLAYDRLVRRHQSAAEREAEGKKRGWVGTLEAGLMRGEARMQGLKERDGGKQELGETMESENGTGEVDWSIAGSESPENEAEGVGGGKRGEEVEEGEDDFTNDLVYLRNRAAESEALGASRLLSRREPATYALAVSDARKTRDKKLGEERWHALLTERFISGRDENFDYRLIDSDEELDGNWIGEQMEEEWFEEQESEIEGEAQGETGVQDF